MDPISQGVLGVVASQNVSQKKHLASAAIIGTLAGMAPDLDVLITSDMDPLLSLEYHRQFTHSLIFIPIGGFLCALCFHLISRHFGLSFGKTLLYCIAGYATHALLDACTSYGTQLFWPFSDHRVSWRNISIIDPLFTLPMVILVVIAAIRKTLVMARVAAIWVLVYLCFGLIQQERVEHVGWQLAQSRDHHPVQLEAKPGFANLLLWKVIYETDDRYYVDGIRAGLQPKIYHGESIVKLDVKKHFPWLNSRSQQARDIERFRWFSNGFVSVHPHYPNRIIDIRYSMLPNEIKALWMIELNPDASPSSHVKYTHVHNNKDIDTTWEKFRLMLLGRDLNYKTQ
ncbi:MAG: metal-dependent hydrolase [Bdellovibrionales bacterium]|nr:metal-dependent hydrolase [Bdellovibrionales bacterium]